MTSYFSDFRLLKFLLACICALAFNQIVSAQPRITTDMRVPVRITELVTSETDTSALVLKQASAVVDKDVTSADGKILIAANTPVQITATLQRTRGRGRGGSILLTPISTTSTDNQTISLSGTYEKKGKSIKGITYLVAGGAFIGTIVVGALLISAGTREDLQDEDEGAGKRLAGGIILGLSPLQWLWLLRHGQAVELKPGFVLEDVKPERSYKVR